MDGEMIIKSTEFLKNETNPDMIYSYGLIAALGNSSLVYDPQTISIGNGYYAAHPVNFSSLLGDMIHIKNYASKTSMGQVLEQAHAINMNLVANVEDDYSGSDWDSTKGLARTLMNLNGDIKSGTAHLTMLQGGTRRSKSAWSKPDIDLDQVYTGTFYFATKMNLTLPVTKTVSEDEWLPCCFGGWLDMINSDKKCFGVNAKTIFDCTCSKPFYKD